MMKPGYLYVLTHPSDPDLYKIGVTVLPPEKRLRQHNNQHDKYAGQIVRETGQEWVLKLAIPVPDPYWAERAFWGALPYSLMPGGVTIEVMKMPWAHVESGLLAAGKAGLRPQPVPRTGPVKNRAWMVAQLEGTGITMLGHYRGQLASVEFQCVHGHQFKEIARRFLDRKSCPICN